MAFDKVGRTNAWSPKCDGRGISNGIMDDYNVGLSIEERTEKFTESARTGDTSRLVIWAGVGAGLIDEIKGAATRHSVLLELHKTIEHLRRSAILLA
ncbi:hypothetical protein C8R44DRAFT_869117 [Mycena epipterygia]|nr:hypothetical protein C8R44DRAFT_869117 [Mycena epipterygia]